MMTRFLKMVILSVLCWGVTAEEVIIEARVALQNFDFSYGEEAGNWQNSSVHTTAPGTTPGVGSRFNTTAGSRIILTPTLQPGGTYLFDAAFPAPGSQSADIICEITLVGCTLTDLSTNTVVNEGRLETFVFRREGGSTSWKPIGTLVMDPDVSTPVITFTHISGALNFTTGRFYSDAYRFVNAAEPCLAGLPVLTTVNGPLAAGQTLVQVPGVATNATKVTVYADGVQIGQKSSGILGGTNVVEVVTSPLFAGQTITVTQHDSNHVESCRPNTGPIVGGGANPQVRISYSLRMDPALTGPAGATGTSGSSWLVMLGATGPAAGFGTAPLGGFVLQPSTCWQTVSYDFNVDPLYTWAGSGNDPGTFAILDSIAFSMEAPFDTGPYAIYIDNITNGTNVIETFEGQTNGTPAYLFTLPSFSGSTSGNLLSQPPGSPTPDISVISDANADTGANSAFVSWQFKDAAAGSWLRLPLLGNGRTTPMVDLSQPISIRFLLLPVGQSNAALQVSAIGNLTKALGDTVTIEVSALKGGPNLTYQWRKDGIDIPNANANRLELGVVDFEDTGTYSVLVSDGTCSTESFGTVTVVEELEQPTIAISRSEGQVTLTWEDPQAVLQAAAALTGSPNDWSDVSNATSPHPVAATEDMRFFRLRR